MPRTTSAAPSSCLRRRRRGFTLVEIVMASLVGFLILAVVMDLLVSGMKLFSAGVDAVRGPEAALMLMDRLEEDIAQCLQAPGDPRPPVVISDEGRKISFYRYSREFSTLNTVVGEPTSWGLEEDEDGGFHPVRGGRVLKEIELLGWSFELIPPRAEEPDASWFVTVTARFDAGGRRSREPFPLTRLIPLPQPSSNYQGFHLGSVFYGTGLFDDLVKLRPPPDDDPSFEGVAPP